MPESSPLQFSVREPSNKYVDRWLLIARALLDTKQNQKTKSDLNVSDKF